MEKREINIGDKRIAEIISEDIIINNPQDALDLMVETGTDAIIINERNLDKAFFDLSSGLAGEILLKFTNYHVKLAVTGNFDEYNGKSLKSFIYESNRTGDFLFMNNVDEIITRWS